MAGGDPSGEVVLRTPTLREGSRGMTGIREAAAADREAIGRLLHEAFRDDPVSRWIFPEEQHLERAHPLLWTAFLDVSLAHGTVHVTEDGAGAALWYSVTGGRMAGGEELGERLAGVDPGNERQETLGELTEKVHPTERDHAYLQGIVVSPGRQSRGTGTALLRHMLRRCDAEGLPAYLEASSGRSRALYERHGFVFLGTAVELPGGPPMFPMWREPAR
jgi:ribosomal protein S18 acetylase RimI-like enzyme